MIDGIMEKVEARLKILNERKRETVPASELIVGMQCGGSDAFSGLTANPALGFCADLLVRAGATVMFSEVTEVRDAIHLLTPRAATREVAEALVREMRWYDDYLANGGVDRGANTTPGNKKGGLSNIIEKSLGSVAKSGTSAINAVLSPGEKVRSRGLVFAATPASDFVCGTLQTGLGHEPACLHHRPRHALRPGRGAGDQGLHPQRTGQALERPDRPGCRPHRHRREDHRAGGLGAVPADAGCGERQEAGLGRQMGPAQ